MSIENKIQGLLEKLRTETNSNRVPIPTVMDPPRNPVQRNRPPPNRMYIPSLNNLYNENFLTDHITRKILFISYPRLTKICLILMYVVILDQRVCVYTHSIVLTFV